MTRITVFGAGAAGTALAIHLARKGEEVTVWGSEHDARVLPELTEQRSHPALPERLPSEVRVLGPDELDDAAKGADLGVLAANSRGARSLARLVKDALPSDMGVVSITKGLEPESFARMSQVYGDETDRPVVAVSGPMLAPELAEGWLTAVAFASEDPDLLERAAAAFRSDAYLVDTTDDVIGTEICGTAKNVAAIAAGVLEGLAEFRQRDLKNARAALFTRAIHEIGELVEAMGGRRDTALGLAGAGDLLVTSLGGRNRAYGHAIGLGAEPQHTLEDMTSRGMTVEGAASANDVHHLAGQKDLDLPIHETVFRVVHEGASPKSILEAMA
jgi:glycerol-3-phosphate dehydrogenase (NAD(P)+)